MGLTFGDFRWTPLKIVDVNERSTKSYQPHATIHNRVSKEQARSVFESTQQAVKQRVSAKGRLRGQAIGIQLLEFREGQPWRVIASVPFA